MRLILSVLLAVSGLSVMPARAEQAVAAKDAIPDKIHAVAVFAGGCFWCMEAEFSHKGGVTDVVSGYAGESGTAPTYKQVGNGDTGFKEAVKVTYDPAVVSYQQLLDIFWSNVDPFDDKGQFCDKGMQYQAAIYYSSDEEKTLAENAQKSVEKKFKKTVATQILPLTHFHPAEDYHQDFYEKNKEYYEKYKKGCERDQTLEDIWGEDDAGEEPAPLLEQDQR